MGSTHKPLVAGSDDLVDQITVEVDCNYSANTNEARMPVE
jgi:hypothetical protein